jgi:hypothetical protein
MTQTLLEAHLQRYPEAHLSDVYRLLHQAVFGSGEAITKKKSTLEWLEHEWSINPPKADAPILESVSPQDALVRLHLRPYRAAGGSMEALLEATLKRDAQGSAAQMAESWGIFTTLAAKNYAERFPAREVRLYGQVYAAQNWPNVPHSPEYIRAYHPAYRVLTLAGARELLGKQGISA